MERGKNPRVGHCAPFHERQVRYMMEDTIYACTMIRFCLKVGKRLHGFFMQAHVLFIGIFYRGSERYEEIYHRTDLICHSHYADLVFFAKYAKRSYLR